MVVNILVCTCRHSHCFLLCHTQTTPKMIEWSFFLIFLRCKTCSYMNFILIIKTFTCHLNHNFNETFIHFYHSNVFLFLLCRIAAASTAAEMENKERPETRVSEFNRVTDACSTRYETRPESSSPSPCLKINKSYVHTHVHTYLRSINNVGPGMGLHKLLSTFRTVAFS